MEQSKFDKETSEGYDKLKKKKQAQEWGGLEPTNDPVKIKRHHRRKSFKKAGLPDKRKEKW